MRLGYKNTCFLKVAQHSRRDMLLAVGHTTQSFKKHKTLKAYQQCNTKGVRLRLVEDAAGTAHSVFPLIYLDNQRGGTCQIISIKVYLHMI